MIHIKNNLLNICHLQDICDDKFYFGTIIVVQYQCERCLNNTVATAAVFSEGRFKKVWLCAES